jgi:hypothetical protein
MKITRRQLRQLMIEEAQFILREKKNDSELEVRSAIVEEMKRFVYEEAEKTLGKLAKGVEERGTEGDFHDYCVGEGFDGVNQSCIDHAVSKGTTKRKQQANLAVTFSKAKGGQRSLTYPKGED